MGRGGRGGEKLPRQSLFRGMLVLSAAGFISKLLGILYRIPLARMVGSEGVGLYQMAYPIYALAMALSTAGFPVAISFLVAERTAQKDYAGAKRVLGLALGMLFFSGLFMSGVLFFGAQGIAVHLLRDGRVYYSLAALAPAIFFTALMSALRGYFQGMQWMTPTAASQVAEQGVRIATILFLAWWLMPYGVEFAAAGAAFGATMGGIAGLMVLLFFYGWNCRQEFWAAISERREAAGGVSSEGAWQLLKRMGQLAWPISLGALVMPLIQTLDAFVVPLRLKAAGFSLEAATGLFGQLSGMAGVLINLPAVVTIALATSLVPSIAAAFSLQQRTAIFYRLDRSLMAAMLVCLPAAVGFYCLGEPICALLYGVPAAGLPLRALAPAVVFLGAYQVSAAALQGLGRTAWPVRHLCWAGALKVGLNYYLVGLPSLGVVGAAMATDVAFAVAAVLNFMSLNKVINYRIPWSAVLIKPGLAVTIMAVLIEILRPTTGRATSVETLALILLGGITYCAGAVLVGAIGREDMRLLWGYLNLK